MIVEQIFKQYYDAHFDDILRYLHWSLRSDDLAQDICQASFEALWVLLEKRKEQLDNPGGWLRKVAQNKVQEYFRTSKRRENKLKQVNHDWERNERSENISRKLELKEAEAEISSAIASLGYPASEIIYLLDVEKKNYKETQEMLGISERTIRRIRKNAWAKLAVKLEQLAFSERLMGIVEDLTGKVSLVKKKGQDKENNTIKYSII